MVFIFGTRLFGQTDAVPGVFYVHTKFFHLNFCPLFPLQSYLVLELRGEANRAIEIPDHGKSILVAWIRFLSSVLFVAALILGLVFATDEDTSVGDKLGWLVPILPLGGLVIWACTSQRLQNATHERAIQLCASVPQHGPRLQRDVDRYFRNAGDGDVVMAEATVLDDGDEEDGFYDEDDAVEITEFTDSPAKKDEAKKEPPIFSFY